MRARVIRVTGLTLVLMLALLAPANAYIDPASTTVIFQVAVAGLAAAGMAVKVFWSRIVGFFVRSKSPSDVVDTSNDVTADH